MPQPDDRILELLTDLAACLCSEITPEDAEEPPTCICQPIPGSFPIQAYAGKGEDMAGVRIVDSFLSTTPGRQWQGTMDLAGGTSMIVEVTVMRCFKVPSNGMLGGALLTEIFTQQVRDLGAMRRALECCTGKSWSKKDMVVGNYRPVGPEGNMYGGAFIIAVML